MKAFRLSKDKGSSKIGRKKLQSSIASKKLSEIDRCNQLTFRSILIWCGDLNYRINYLKRDDIFEMIKEQKYDELLEYDQLSIERNAGRTFQMFDEGRIAFNPTYKYDPGTDSYDTR
jgi:phosphatidylinositol-bisphosphatase